MAEGRTSAVADRDVAGREVPTRADEPAVTGGSDDRLGGRTLIPALTAFTVILIGMDALFDRTLIASGAALSGVIGLTDAVAASFVRPFALLTGSIDGWGTAVVAIAGYSAVAALALRALRRLEATLDDQPAE